jgi:hypothetical protein
MSPDDGRFYLILVASWHRGIVASWRDRTITLAVLFRCTPLTTVREYLVGFIKLCGKKSIEGSCP